MQRVVAVVVLLLVLATAAFASETSWRIGLRADDGSGNSYGPVAQFGVYPTSTSLLDAQEGSPFYWGAYIPQSCTKLLTRIPEQPEAYMRDIRAPQAPPIIWDFYVGAETNYVQSQFRIQAFTVNSTALPISAWQGNAVKYSLKMVDNKGVAGAPANGAIWDMPIPTVHVSGSAYWTMPVMLPALVLSANSSAALFAEGYRMQFIQAPVPEPSSLVALGTGLFATGGLILHRRRR